jgi:hypothetical protein
MNNAVCSATITLAQHHHHNYAAGTGHKSAFIFIIITRQQDQSDCPPSSHSITSPTRFSNKEIRTAGSGHTTVKSTRQTAIWQKKKNSILKLPTKE